MSGETTDYQVGQEAVGAKAPTDQSTPIPSEVTTSNATTDPVTPGGSTTPSAPVSAVLTGAPPETATLPIHIYPKQALALVKLKCPTLRSYCTNGATDTMNQALISGLNQTLSLFDGGREDARAACGTASGYDQARFDADMAVGLLPELPVYTCMQIRAGGATTCPAGGCPLPSGEIAENPADLFAWACNMKEVGLTVIAKSVIASEFAGSITSVNDALYAYHDGIYTGVSDITLSRAALPHLGLNVKPRHVAELVKMVLIQCDRLMDGIRPDPNFICFSNGTLDVATGILGPHSPEHMLLNRIPHAYSADAGCDGFMTFLNGVWANDTDRDQKIQLIRQWIGYLLVADSSMQKMLILTGLGANGKSVLMDLIKAVVDDKNTINAMLSDLSKSYVRSTVEGKLLNVSPDLPKKGIVADGEFKALVGGDDVEAAAKYKDSHTIKPYVRLMVATNNMPNCKDTSNGFFRRLMILTFNRKFAENERNPNLLRELIPEIPGIVAWALEGLYELRAQGRFTIPESSELAVRLYQEEISPVQMFADECLVASTDRIGIRSSDLFMAFRGWCRDRGFGPGSIVTLGRDLSALDRFGQRKSSQTWWLVSAKEDAQEYFRPAQIVPGIRPISPNPGLALAA